VKQEHCSKFCPTNFSQTFTMDAPLSYASIEAIVKRVETFGGGVWAQELFCSVQNFEIPHHNCGKLYGGLACKAWLVVQASLYFGEEQTMVNLRARP
jgi:hypothetical protein